MAASERPPWTTTSLLRTPFNVVADPEGGYSVHFPDLPGCLTQVESLDELPAMVEEARTLWLEVEYEQGHDIPLPSYPEEYSGRFNLRLPRSLQRSLAQAAEHEGLSLNQYVVYLLSRGDAQARVERKLDDLAGGSVPERRGAPADSRARRAASLGRAQPRINSRP